MIFSLLQIYAFPIMSESTIEAVFGFRKINEVFSIIGDEKNAGTMNNEWKTLIF